MLRIEPQSIAYRLVAILAGLAMLTLGLSPISTRHEFFYANWFGGLVFTPLAICFGVLTIAFPIFKPEWLGSRRWEQHEKHRSARAERRRRERG